MVRISTRSIVVALGCFVVFGFLPASAGAQSSTFVIPLDRTGTPGTTTVDSLDPLTGQPITMTVDTGAFVNPCTTENVDVIGSTTVSTTQTVDRFGNLKVSISVTSKGTGLGWVPLADGTQQFTESSYAFTEGQNFSFRKPLDGSAFTSDFTDKIAMRGAKSIDNWIIRTVFRIKVSASGDIQVFRIRENEGACRG